MLRDPSLIPLSRQHQHGLALGVLTKRSLAQDSADANVAALAKRAVDHYELELANHFAIEEEVLFPALAPQPLIPELIGEHRRLEELIAELRQAPSVESLTKFCDLLATHIRREENELFQYAQSHLPAGLLAELGGAIASRAVSVCLTDPLLS
jgi:hemerythrin-like domain-containing protein